MRQKRQAVKDEENHEQQRYGAAELDECADWDRDPEPFGERVGGHEGAQEPVEYEPERCRCFAPG